MKKTLLAMLLVAVLMTLVACGGNDSAKADIPEFTLTVDGITFDETVAKDLELAHITKTLPKGGEDVVYNFEGFALADILTTLDISTTGITGITVASREADPFTKTVGANIADMYIAVLELDDNDEYSPLQGKSAKARFIDTSATAASTWVGNLATVIILR